MKRYSNLLTFAACIVLVVTWSVEFGRTADAPSYTGKYSLENRKTTSGGTDQTLEVVQNESAVEVTTVVQGRRTTNRYPLNGSEGDYASPSGVPGKCKAQLMGKQLILDSTVVTRPQPTGSPVRMHTKERWQLSADSKTLTIQTDVDFPDFPADISAAVNGNTSGKEKYRRVE
jgi:hypothetical protein